MGTSIKCKKKDFAVKTGPKREVAYNKTKKIRELKRKIKNLSTPQLIQWQTNSADQRKKISLGEPLYFFSGLILGQKLIEPPHYLICQSSAKFGQNIRIYQELSRLVLDW